MSNNGWGACATCHPFGLSDDVVWIFPSGPKRTIPQHTDFDQTDALRTTMRPLNWSAERDEEEDFDLNIRAVSGGPGLIVLADGVTPDPNVTNLIPLASDNRNQLKVGRGRRGCHQPMCSSASARQFRLCPRPSGCRCRAGLFTAANCQQCHGGRSGPPPCSIHAAARSRRGQSGRELPGELRIVGTFDPAAFNEVRQNGAAPLVRMDRFTFATLLFAFPQTFFHNARSHSMK
jgi:hypothetical protein